MEEEGSKAEEQPPTSTQEVTTEEKPLSKNQLKKLARRQKFLENKKEFKQKKKERLKAKRAADRLNGTVEGKNPISRKVLAKNKPDYENKTSIKLAVDLSFDHLMTDPKLIASCVSQLMRIYTCNRRQNRPLPVYFTSLKEGNPMQQQLEKTQYKSWDIKTTEKSFIELFPKDKIVYLTAESDTVLERFSPGTLYVIGGLVDHNAHKGLTHDIATKEGLKTARLPIAEHVNLKSRHVLTINHVAEIMIRKANGRTWKQVFKEILPKRKGFEIIEKKNDSDSVAAGSDKDEKDSSSSEEESSEVESKKRKKDSTSSSENSDSMKKEIS